MKYKAVIWDLDGTLLDTLGDLGYALNASVALYGYGPVSREEVKARIGDGIGKLIERSIGPDNGHFEDIFAAFRKEYTDHCVVDTVPYAGIKELLEDIRSSGAINAVVTNKLDSVAARVAEHYYPGCFAGVLGERAGVPRKPDPAMLNMMLEQLGLDRNEAVYVGDSGNDILIARNAGLDGIAVSYGFRSREQLMAYHPDRIADTVDGLRELLEVKHFHAQ